MDIIENSEVIMKMPPWSIGKVLIYGFTGVSLVLFIVATAMSPKPSNSNFMFFELLKQSSFVYFLVQMIGMCYIYEVSFMPKNQGLLLLSVTSFIIYMFTLTMAYAQTSNCEKPKREIGFFYSFLPVMGLIIGYILATKISGLRQGFYDLTGGDHNELAYWAAVGFWMAACIWPLLTTAYFTIKKASCNNDNEIKVRKIEEKQATDQII
tara:strand:- start:9449 stop:10075 length:627 start_codon:yes stop_codon:yes gene_type:complete